MRFKYSQWIVNTHLLFLSLLTTLSGCHTQQKSINTLKGNEILNSPDYIVWGETEISWKDFKGHAPSNKKFAAGTYAGISFAIQQNGDIKAFAFFSKHNSWQKHTSDYTLIHEKYHFTIVELFARKIRKDLKEQRICFDTTKIFNEYVAKVWTQVEKMQNEYDVETNHSINQKSQKDWQIKIDDEMDNLKDYKNITIEN